MKSNKSDIYVERCIECPMHHNINMDEMWCRVKNPNQTPRMGPWDRKFPRWCPLLKGSITIAAEKPKGKGGSQ